MRVMTMNVFAHHRDWEKRREVLIAGFQALAPEIVLLQEIVLTEGYDQARDILGSGYQIHHQPGRSDDGVGASIASQWPLDVVLEVGLDHGELSWTGSLAVARVDVPSPIGPVLVAHHKPTWRPAGEADRERQAVAAARHIETILPEQQIPVILAGDLDAPPHAASIRFLTGMQSLEGMSVRYHDAWAARHDDAPGHTFSPANGIRSDSWRPRPAERIDYIMVRGAEHGAPLDVVRCDLAFDKPVDGVWASDHIAVVADLMPVPASNDHP